MSPINPNDPDALKALIKLVELSYNDLLQPAFRQIGSAAGTVLGLCNSALLPIKLLNAKTDAVFKANVRKLEAQVELIPEEKRVQIPPEIGVPILDRLTYVSNETLSDLFVNLLSSASSTDMFSTAHPSFIHVIDKLTPDEARILKHLY
ncbi:MAG: Abi-alpha family protein, partial [Candidatus Promineifilaceae bacterium]